MTEFTQALQELNDLTWNAIAARCDKLTGQAVSVPQLQPLAEEQNESRFDNDIPALAHLDRALELAAQYELADIAAGFAALADGLRWSQNPTYDETNCDPAFLNGYAYAAFSGPDAPIRCSVPRGGLLIMAPDVTYPGHNHGPREVYLVLTPGSQWRLDQGEWFDVMPGDLIYHDAWQIHSMRTASEPLLAFAGWVEAGERLSINWNERPGKE